MTSEGRSTPAAPAGRPWFMANELLAFVVELVALAALAWWGLTTGDGAAAQLVLGLGTPAVAIVLWGMFAAPRARFRPGGRHSSTRRVSAARLGAQTASTALARTRRVRHVVRRSLIAPYSRLFGLASAMRTTGGASSGGWVEHPRDQSTRRVGCEATSCPPI
ncbi:YrdB family protein [Streptomyces sp. BE133]|uniref:YrdB family protein n=1 Tax=Streptomyces sp. BE133 TaxID=3002523 RepID=UPI002E76AF0F|nr:YrdB family protein [Streptomyces sp. BE133]MEE1807055.1 YrdB family protein [Streptomyces sp. BE133]